MSSIRKRVFGYLDAARERGAFLVSGIFCGLDADYIADEIARETATNRDGLPRWQRLVSGPQIQQR
jgi:hypothetical protein